MELLLSNEQKTEMFQPVVEEGIEWSTNRSSEPGKLVFKVIKDEILDFSEGSIVRFSVNGKGVFWGYVFKQQRDKDGIITVTAYDQIRYLKNKDSLQYKEKTASQLLKSIAEKYKFPIGTIEDTKYIIIERIEKDKSYLEMLENALNLTLQNSNKIYIFYDDFGTLNLKSLNNMRVREGDEYLMIDEETGENYEYNSSIDDNTFNRIKLKYDSTESENRQSYVSEDVKSIQRWGVLQYTDTLKEGENGPEKAKKLLSRYNMKTKSLKISNALGDLRVRGGSMIVVNLNLVDMKIRSFMLVESVKHTFKGTEHWMDLTLKGGEINA